jgi:hypothetical protein
MEHDCKEFEDTCGDCIREMQAENAKLRAEVARLELQVEEYRKLLTQWMDAGNLAQDTFAPIYKRTEFSLVTEKRKCENKWCELPLGHEGNHLNTSSTS